MEQKTEASQAVKFRKKPVEIEAIQWTGKLDCLDAFSIPELHQSLGSDKVGIPTLEGTMIAHVGDWVIKGVKGEFYPCKPDIFELTYEQAALKAHPPTEDYPALYQMRYPLQNGKGMGAWHATSKAKYTERDEYPELEFRCLYEQSAPTEAEQGEAGITASGFPATIADAKFAIKQMQAFVNTDPHLCLLLDDNIHTLRTFVHGRAEATLAERTDSAAQGEDSARLDAERIEFDAAAFETAIGEAPNRIITDKTPWGWRYRRAAMQDEFMEFRARASAETGGVK